MKPADPRITRDAAWLGLDVPAARLLLEPVAVAYSEPQRRYHDDTHLTEMLEAVHALRAHCRDFRAVLLAAWFHDAVYWPERRDNEAQSAAWAGRALPAAGFGPDLVAEVERLVLGTDPASPAPADADARVIHDADRRVWAAAPARYAEYARGIRAEYARFGWSRYAAGRSRFLGGALRRAQESGRLFFHLDAAEERSGRRNLERERESLRPLRVWRHRLLRRDPLASLAQG